MDVLEGDLAPDGLWQGGRAGRVLHAVFHMQQFHQPLGGPGGALQFAPDFGQGGDGARHHHRVDHELHQRAFGHQPGAHVDRADPEHADDAREHQEDHDHRHRRPGADALAGHVE